MKTNQTIAQLDTVPSARWYHVNSAQHKMGVVNHMSRVSTGSRARIKVRYTERLRRAIQSAL